MNTKTKTVAAAVEYNEAETAVVKLIESAVKHSTAADSTAREAAAKAIAAHDKGEQSEAEAYAAIVARYASALSNNKHVKDVFSAAVSVLLRGREVTLVASAFAPQKGGKLSVKAPEVLAQDERAPGANALENDGKEARTLSAADCVTKLSSDLLKKVAAVSRQEMGIGGTGGRPQAKKETKPTAGRLPINEEVAFILASPDSPAFLALTAAIAEAGYKLVRTEKKAGHLAAELAAANAGK